MIVEYPFDFQLIAGYPGQDLYVSMLIAEASNQLSLPLYEFW